MQSNTVISSASKRCVSPHVHKHGTFHQRKSFRLVFFCLQKFFLTTSGNVWYILHKAVHILHNYAKSGVGMMAWPKGKPRKKTAPGAPEGETPKKKTAAKKKDTDGGLLLTTKDLLDGGAEHGFARFKKHFPSFNEKQYVFARCIAHGDLPVVAYRKAGGSARYTQNRKALDIEAGVNELMAVPQMQDAITFLRKQRRVENMDRFTIMDMYLDLYDKTDNDMVKRAVLSDLSKITGVLAPQKVDLNQTVVSISCTLQAARERQMKYLNDGNTIEADAVVQD